jgi:hypothetical protein
MAAKARAKAVEVVSVDTSAASVDTPLTHRSGSGKGTPAELSNASSSW